ncbi:MAG: hypothetical protein SPI86_04545 [Treponemataceae bacterium]|nr:hypothetical protein [Spirochaetales bacterium]MDY6031018.1 hypothetical protein [Treponemataceae bacterium]
MDKKFKECTERLRKLVSDIQGAPYPGDVQDELYFIWYEHVQKSALECYEFLDKNFPDEAGDVGKTLTEVLDN